MKSSYVLRFSFLEGGSLSTWKILLSCITFNLIKTGCTANKTRSKIHGTKQKKTKGCKSFATILFVAAIDILIVLLSLFCLFVFFGY